MPRTNLTAIVALCVLVAVGCSQSSTDEPKKLAEVVGSQAAEPIAKPAEPAAKSANEPVGTVPAESQVAKTAEKANFLEEVPAGDEAAVPATVPPVELSKEHAALCRVKVGDALPEVELPQTSGGNAKLSSLYGKSATVIVFWKGDRQMALDELADLGPDVVQKFGSRGVEVVGVAVDQPAADAQSAVQQTAANFPQLVDADGKAFEQVGSQMLPWTLVLDADGKIVWFDLEYSLSTRRELQQALLATVR
jgi:peroxiredoxin